MQLYSILKGHLQGQQERGERGKGTLPAFAARLMNQRGQNKKVAVEKSCQNKVCSIFDAD